MGSAKIVSFKEFLLGYIKSSKFFYFILALFVIEGVWIAFSALYPQAFDEDFHFGIIRIYSHYWLPFLSHQPANADAYGAVARDPSYLYHYLMSFPYRFLNLFIHSQTAMVIALRLINVAIFSGGLILFRRVLLRVGMSVSLANITLLLFILIPIVPQLAAQINYDNLVFLLTAWVCLQTFNITDQIRARKISSKSLLILAITTILASITKYAFLPIAACTVGFVAVMIYRYNRGKLGTLLTNLKTDLLKHSAWVKIGLPLLLLVSIGMFMQRDGYNLIKYHSLAPDCSRVLSVKQCEQYSVWSTDYNRHMQLTSGYISVQNNFFLYFVKWFYWMGYRLFFAVNGEASGYANNPPLPLPVIAAILVSLAALFTAIRLRTKLFHNNPYLIFLLAISLTYGISLFTKGYSTYQYTAYMENMNGRYLIPILFPLAAIGGLGISMALKHSQTKKLIAASFIVLLFLEGGGLLTFIVNSDSTWYWDNSTVIKVNTTAKKIATHVVIKKKS